MSHAHPLFLGPDSQDSFRHGSSPSIMMIPKEEIISDDVGNATLKTEPQHTEEIDSSHEGGGKGIVKDISSENMRPSKNTTKAVEEAERAALYIERMIEEQKDAEEIKIRVPKRGKPRKRKKSDEIQMPPKARCGSPKKTNKPVKVPVLDQSLESRVVLLRNGERTAFGDLVEFVAVLKETPNFQETEQGLVVCMLCNMNVGDKRQEHMDKFHPAMKNCFRCKTCAKTSKYIKQIISHVQKFHLKEDQYKECKKCHARFWEREKYEEHCAKCQGKPNHIGGMCSQCGVYFYHLNKHVKTHLDKPKSYQCLKCPSAFTDSILLKKHVQDIHTDCEKDHVMCAQCGKYFKNYMRLAKHRNVVHPKKLMKCQLCFKEFKTADALKKHALIHSDSKPMSCDYCDFACRQRNSMDVHMNTHHKDKIGTKERKKQWMKK